MAKIHSSSSPVASKGLNPPAPKPAFYQSVALWLGVLGCCLYGWTLDYPLVFDDYFYMKENPFFLEAREYPQLRDFREFAQSPEKRHLDPDLATNIILRPVAYASLHLNHALEGFNPRWYRAFNIVVHVLNAWLIFRLLAFLGRRRGLAPDSVFWVSAGTALLFVVHPLATESVTYIIQRFTSLSTAFYLLVICFYFAAMDSGESKRRRLLLGTSVLMLILGMLTKEDLFTAPLMVVLLDWLMLGQFFKKAFWRARWLLACLPLIPLLVMLTSWAQNGGDWSLWKALNIVNLRNQPWSPWHYLLTQCTVVVDYMRQIFWPSALNVLPEWPVYHSLLQLPVSASLALILALLFGSLWLRFRRGDAAHGSLILAALLWFFITVSISSSFVPLPDMKADHRTYLPSIGWIMGALVMVDWLRLRFFTSNRSRSLLWASLAVVLLIMAGVTVQRNQLWHSNIGLWQDTVEKSPKQFIAWMNLGAAHAEAGEHEQAIECARQALKIKPHLVVAKMNMVHSLVILERWRECLDVSMPLIAVCPEVRQRENFMFNVGLAQAGVGHYHSALETFESLHFGRENDYKLNKVIGLVHVCLRHPRRALAHLQKARELQPADPVVQRVIHELINSQPLSVQL
jgi:hypothetical protein